MAEDGRAAYLAWTEHYDGAPPQLQSWNSRIPTTGMITAWAWMVYEKSWPNVSILSIKTRINTTLTMAEYWETTEGNSLLLESRALAGGQQGCYQPAIPSKLYHYLLLLFTASCTNSWTSTAGIPPE
jgi:hypothetical protein